MRYLFALIALGLLVAFHEFGHLVMARALRVKVHRFVFGFGPPLFTTRWLGIRFILGAIPLGGSVHIHGINPHDQTVDEGDETTFLAQPAWKRILIILSGSVANLLLAFVLLLILYARGTHVPVPLTVGTVEPGSPAARAQLRPGDVLESVEGQPLRSWTHLINEVDERVGERVTLTFAREGKTTTTQVVPMADPWGQGRLGIAEQYVYREHDFRPSLKLAAKHQFAVIIEGVRLLLNVAQGKSGLPLLAPTTLVRQASVAADSGLDGFLRLVVGLSMALAVFHLLPLPSLDGGRIALTVVEFFRGKALNPKVETLLHTAGFALLIGGVIFLATAALRDLLRLQKEQETPPTHTLPPPARLRNTDPGFGPEEEEGTATPVPP